MIFLILINHDHENKNHSNPGSKQVEEVLTTTLSTRTLDSQKLWQLDFKEGLKKGLNEVDYKILIYK